MNATGSLQGHRGSNVVPMLDRMMQVESGSPPGNPHSQSLAPPCSSEMIARHMLDGLETLHHGRKG